MNWIKITPDLFSIISGTSYASRSGAIKKCRKYFRSIGIEPNPVGVTNSKTQVPGTYRPVGPTCPDSCPFLGDGDGSCYAKFGPAGLAQKRASSLSVQGAASAAIAMVLAAYHGEKARLHVSGDFIALGNDGKIVDVEYIDALCQISASICQHLGVDSRVNAWSYTHIDRESFLPFHKQLKEAGINVVWSDHAGSNGALVWDHEAIDELKDLLPPGVKAIPCPAQTHESVTCKSCDLCSRLAQLNRVIIFHAHGVKRKGAMETSRAKLNA